MMDIDPKLLEKIQQALHQTLMTMVRSVVAIGATPQTVIGMIRERLDMIETMVKEEERGAATDGVVRPDGGAGEAAEAALVAEAKAGGGSADVRRERLEDRTGNPNRTTGTDNQAAYGPRPGYDPGEPF
jgi:hypothetical protein